VGLERLRLIKNAVTVPVVAIGGINLENVKRVKMSGADSVAVISAITDTDSPENATRELIKTFEE
jgi:thiamine-phosphate pyrophosphorylase